MTPLVYTEAVSVAQSLMKVSKPSLNVDGKWGSFTQSIFASLSEREQQRVTRMIAAIAPGVTPASLAAYRQAQKLNVATQSVFNRADVDKAISAAAAQSGVPEATLRRFAQIESNFNHTAVNGKSRGLMQMQPAAWKDASKLVALRPYADAVFDPYENAKAGAFYIKVNKGYLDGLGYRGPWDVAHMYLAHQQGAGGLMAMWNAAHGKPSALDTEKMRANPPQDRKGVTTDPKEFYSRWVAVVNSK